MEVELTNTKPGIKFFTNAPLKDIKKLFIFISLIVAFVEYGGLINYFILDNTSNLSLIWMILGVAIMVFNETMMIRKITNMTKEQRQDCINKVYNK